MVLVSESCTGTGTCRVHTFTGTGMGENELHAGGQRMRTKILFISVDIPEAEQWDITSPTVI